MPFDITNPTSVKRASSALLKSLTVIGDSLLSAGDKNYPQSEDFVVYEKHFKDHGPARKTFGSVSPRRIMIVQSQLTKSVYVSDGCILLGPIAQHEEDLTKSRGMVDCDGVLPKSTEPIDLTGERSEKGHYILSTGAYLNPVYLATALLYLSKDGADRTDLHLSQKQGDIHGPIVIYLPNTSSLVAKYEGRGQCMAVIMPMRAD
jgi:hypothetical protein